ncbi:hypothetical protein [Sphingomonas sp.]|jgi:type VI protein secretion system component VasF|uniref:hypothetical protein n=1 Tax=Sphingomonas sp. TaxID=28214 RepID=UPI0025E67684|nr:hypothetical protein [Sphingomonas sp.]
MADPAIPQDMRDLLIRLDQRVTDGFATINQRLDAFDRRAENLDARVTKLETAEVKRAGELAGAQRLGSYLKIAVTALVAVVGYLGYQIELAPRSDRVVSKTVIQTPSRS